MATAKNKPAKPSDDMPESDALPDAVEELYAAPDGDFSDEVAALASSRIVEDEDEDEGSDQTLQIEKLDENGEVVTPEKAPELFSAIEFRAGFRKLFDGPQHVPPGMPVLGPIFGPDWEAFAISPMTEPGFNATSDEVYSFLKKMVPSILEKRDNKALLIGGFVVTQVYIAMSIIRARKMAVIATQRAAQDKPDNDDAPPPDAVFSTEREKEYEAYGS